MKKIFLIFCLDTKETKNQEATSRSGKNSVAALLQL
jgi:hypothetical protein